jgi:hypothetical protein
MEIFDIQRTSKKVLAKSIEVKAENVSDMSNFIAKFKSFQVGQRVRLQGLSDSALNGAEGWLTKPEIDGCLLVKLEKALASVSVKWENVEWLTRRPVHEMVVHYSDSMLFDEVTGKSLNHSEIQKRMLDILHARNIRHPRNVIMIYESDVCTDHMAQTESCQFLQLHIGKLQNAYYAWVGYGHPVNYIDTECLLLYEALFADMVQHSQIWNHFFEDIKNTCWCEKSVGVLNSYATVLRQRAEKQREQKDEQALETIFRCEKVLNLGGKQLKRYKDSLTNPLFFSVVHRNDAAKFLIDQKCAESLSYLYLLIKHNLLLMTGRGRNIKPSEVRFLCLQELDPSLDFHFSMGKRSGNRLATVMRHLNRPCSRQSLSMTTDAEISVVYKLISKSLIKSELFNKMCGCCGYFEEEGRRLKRCGGCLIEFYCSSECQQTAWSDHRHICNPVSKSE